MNRVLRKDDRKCSVLALEPGLRLGVEALAHQAARILEQEEAAAKIANLIPGLLDGFREGVAALRKVADQASDLVVIEEAEAQRAFVTCCFLATHVKTLPLECRRGLGQVLLLLAECFCVGVAVGAIPPLASLPPRLGSHTIINKLYPDLWAARDSSDRKFQLTLADAFALLEALEIISSPIPLVMLRFDLWSLTGEFRMALSHLTVRKP